MPGRRIRRHRQRYCRQPGCLFPGRQITMQITTTGIVLREREHDDDRILTILTAERGVITAYARGAKKLRGRLLSGTELLCCSRFVLFQYRDRYQVDAAETEQNFFGLRGDVEKLSLAVYLAQLCAQVAPAEEEAGEFLRLMLNSLYLLEKDKRSQRLIKAVFAIGKTFSFDKL